MNLLHLAPLILAAVSVCCVGRGGRGASLAIMSSLVMLAAMLDTATGARVLWPAVWAVGLLALAPLPAVAARLRLYPVARSGRGGIGPPGGPCAAATSIGTTDVAMQVHRGLGLVTMAALTLVGATPGSVTSGTAPVAGSSGLGHHGDAFASSASSPMALVGVVAFSVLSVVVLARCRRGPGRSVVSGIEAASMGLSVLLMAAAG